MENIEKEYDELLKSSELTEEDIKAINDTMEENVANNETLSFIKDLPSNNGVEESEKLEITPAGIYKKANIILDPATGENKILSTEDEEYETVDDTTFEQLMEDVESGKIKVKSNDSPITEQELKDNINAFNPNPNDDKFKVSDEALEELLKIANRKMNKEEFNVYKSLPQEVKDMIDREIGIYNAVSVSNEMRYLRNSIAESLLNDFIMNITINRARSDLGKEIETVFAEGAKDIAQESVKYTEERNKKYREQVENMEDEEKKQHLLKVLDTMDSAYTLDPLKEFAKTCKLKRYDIEDPKKYFRDFADKYKDSNYNIYDIKLTLTPLEKKIVDNEKYNQADIIAFLVCFCKYIFNFKVEDIFNHTFMYYVIYNIIIMGANVAEDTVEKSNIFADNIREVIDNLKARNSFLN